MTINDILHETRKRINKDVAEDTYGVLTNSAYPTGLGYYLTCQTGCVVDSNDDIRYLSKSAIEQLEDEI